MLGPIHAGADTTIQDYKSDDGKKVMFDANVESLARAIHLLDTVAARLAWDLRTRTFTVEEDTGRLPWQLAGEPDIKSGTRDSGRGSRLL